jgi:ATPase subunit of ABC transporter with duplicated ATPase domains
VVQASPDVVAIAINPDVNGLTAAVVGLGGAVRMRETILSPEILSPEDAILLTKDFVDRVAAELPPTTRVAGVGVAVPGLVDERTNSITNAPYLRWHDEPFAAMLEEALALPTWLSNDSTLGVIAETRYGAGVGFDNVMYLNGSTSGLGGGIVTEVSGRRAAIRERLEAEWKRPLDDLLRAVQPLEMEDDALRSEAAALQQQLDALGPVNPLAIEEHEEEVKRLDFLSTQRADLTEARNSLHAAIREIDATARELFITTFTQVRENFRRIFMTLFGGGECDLRLENPDAPLDCDIEVHASPRGKRTQRIHLLSSGERALVALSLLFGIFLTKPSPFCLLDEVDAPLDDANIGRFVRMLNEFKQKTQFIVITHNPRTTTEAADAVYGITMQEPGVSSVVSVRMRGPQVDDTATERDAPIERSMPVDPVSEAITTSL